MADCKNCIHIEVCKSADSCDGRVPGCRHFEPKTKHGRWVWDVESHGDPMYGIDEDYGYRCSECQVWADEYGVDGDIYEEQPTHILHYCPNCGAIMDLPRITDYTMKALEAMDRKAHGGE